MSITNSGGKTLIVMEGSSNEALINDSTWTPVKDPDGTPLNGGYPEFVLVPETAPGLAGGTKNYLTGVDSAIVVAANNPCYRYLELEINDWRVEDWYRRRVTDDNKDLEADYGSYDYLDIYIGLPLNNNPASYTKTFWARLGGATFDTQGESAGGLDDYFRSYHEGNMRIVPEANNQKKFVIDMAQNWSAADSQTDGGGNPRYAYYLSGSVKATENEIDTRPEYIPTGSIAHVMFFWHTEAERTDAWNSDNTLGRYFEITCSFHEKLETTAFYADGEAGNQNALQRQNPAFMQYPAVTAHTHPTGTPGLTSSIEGDNVWYPTSNRSAPPTSTCSEVKELPTNFTATVTGDFCDADGSVLLSWTEVTSSTGYTFYNIYVDDSTTGVNPADSNTYTTKIGPIWGTCFPPPNAGGLNNSFPGTEPNVGWARRGENVGGSGNANQTQSGSTYIVEHLITGLNPSQTYRYALEAVDFCTASEIIAVTASWLTTELTCSEPYYFNDDYSINYYKCLPFQFNRKNAAGTSYCPTEGVPFSYGTRGVVIRYPKTPYSGNLG